MKANKVPVQKGEMKVDTNSYKNMPYGTKVTEREKEIRKLREGRDMKPMKKK
jgi:hypothetical protein